LVPALLKLVLFGIAILVLATNCDGTCAICWFVLMQNFCVVQQKLYFWTCSEQNSRHSNFYLKSTFFCDYLPISLTSTNYIILCMILQLFTFDKVFVGQPTEKILVKCGQLIFFSLAALSLKHAHNAGKMVSFFLFRL